jgi:hypothetical protein
MWKREPFVLTIARLPYRDSRTPRTLRMKWPYRNAWESLQVRLISSSANGIQNLQAISRAGVQSQVLLFSELVAVRV